MFQNILKVISVAAVASLLLSACSEQDKSAETAESTKQTSEVSQDTRAPAAEAATPESAADLAQVMDLPVNFSTPEDVEKSIERVRQGAGDKKAKQLSVAMSYILTYDLGIGNDKEKMYKKLNGSTPNEIIAKMKR